MHRMAEATVQYINFVDFEKAFDSIHRDRLWGILLYADMEYHKTSSFSLIASTTTLHVRWEIATIVFM